MIARDPIQTPGQAQLNQKANAAVEMMKGLPIFTVDDQNPFAGSGGAIASLHTSFHTADTLLKSRQKKIE